MQGRQKQHFSLAILPFFLLLEEMSTGQLLKTLLVTRLQLFMDEQQSHFRAAFLYLPSKCTHAHAHTHTHALM